jgi:hypothetical protein
MGLQSCRIIYNARFGIKIFVIYILKERASIIRWQFLVVSFARRFVNNCHEVVFDDRPVSNSVYQFLPSTYLFSAFYSFVSDVRKCYYYSNCLLNFLCLYTQLQYGSVYGTYNKRDIFTIGRRTLDIASLLTITTVLKKKRDSEHCFKSNEFNCTDYIYAQTSDNGKLVTEKHGNTALLS